MKLNKNKKISYIEFDKLLYLKFQKIIDENELLQKSFEELGIKDENSYKMVYLHTLNQTFVFLTQIQNTKEQEILIPEPLIFLGFFKENYQNEKIAFLVFKEQYALLVEYNKQNFYDAKSIPLHIIDEQYIQKLKNNYKEIFSINNHFFKSLTKLEDLYQKDNIYEIFLNSNTNFMLYFSNHKNTYFSIKVFAFLFLGILVALTYFAFLATQNHFHKKQIQNFNTLIKQQKYEIKKIEQIKKDEQIKKQNIKNASNKANILKEFYKNSLCYKDFYDFIKILNQHKAQVQNLQIDNNVFSIEFLNDYDFYDDFKNKNFKLKNKEIHNGKIKLIYEKNT